MDLIHQQAKDHIALVNAYGAYARKLKLDISKQLKMFDELAHNFSDIVLKPTYKASLFDSDGPIDEDMRRSAGKKCLCYIECYIILPNK